MILYFVYIIYNIKYVGVVFIKKKKSFFDFFIYVVIKRIFLMYVIKFIIIYCYFNKLCKM